MKMKYYLKKSCFCDYDKLEIQKNTLVMVILYHNDQWMLKFHVHYNF